MPKPMPLIAALAIATLPFAAEAAVIQIADFSGTETVVSFNNTITGIQTFNSPLTFGPLLITNAGGFFRQGDNLKDRSADGRTAMTLDAPRQRVGLTLNAASERVLGGIAEWRVSVFDAAGGLLESALFAQPAPLGPDVGGAVFAGFQRTEGIASFLIEETTQAAPLLLNNGTFAEQNYFTDFSFVRLENLPAGAAVPLPAGLPLLAGALGGLALLRRRRT